MRSNNNNQNLYAKYVKKKMSRKTRKNTVTRYKTKINLAIDNNLIIKLKTFPYLNSIEKQSSKIFSILFFYHFLSKKIKKNIKE